MANPNKHYTFNGVRRIAVNEKKAEKKAPAKAGAKLLRQVSYRQETYRAVILVYTFQRYHPSIFL